MTNHSLTADTPASDDTRLARYWNGAKYSKNLTAALRFHAHLQHAWGDPIPLEYWPHPERQPPVSTWTELAPATDYATDLLHPDEEDGEFVNVYQLTNLLLTTRYTVTHLITQYGLPAYNGNSRARRGRTGKLLHLGQTLRILAAPSEGPQNLTRMRAAWGIVAIASGLWTPQTGYLLSPDDHEAWQAHLDAQKPPRDELSGPALREAIDYTRSLVRDVAYRRFREQTELFQGIRDLGPFVTPGMIHQLWEEQDWGGKA